MWHAHGNTGDGDGDGVVWWWWWWVKKPFPAWARTVASDWARENHFTSLHITSSLHYMTTPINTTPSYQVQSPSKLSPRAIFKLLSSSSPSALTLIEPSPSPSPYHHHRHNDHDKHHRHHRFRYCNSITAIMIVTISITIASATSALHSSSICHHDSPLLSDTASASASRFLCIDAFWLLAFLFDFLLSFSTITNPLRLSFFFPYRYSSSCAYQVYSINHRTFVHRIALIRINTSESTSSSSSE